MRNTMRTAMMLAGAQIFAGVPIIPEYEPTPRGAQSDSSKEYYHNKAQEKRKRKALIAIAKDKV